MKEETAARAVQVETNPLTLTWYGARVRECASAAACIGHGTTINTEMASPAARESGALERTWPARRRGAGGGSKARAWLRRPAGPGQSARLGVSKAETAGGQPIGVADGAFDQSRRQQYSATDSRVLLGRATPFISFLVRRLSYNSGGPINSRGIYLLPILRDSSVPTVTKQQANGTVKRRK